MPLVTGEMSRAHCAKVCDAQRMVGTLPGCQFPHVERETEGLWAERLSELCAFRQTGPGLDLKGPEHPKRNRDPLQVPNRPCGLSGGLPGSDVTPRSRAQRLPECCAPSARLWWDAGLRGLSPWAAVRQLCHSLSFW